MEKYKQKVLSVSIYISILEHKLAVTLIHMLWFYNVYLAQADKERA